MRLGNAVAYFDEGESVMKLNVIMPMAGGGTRFGKQGFDLPKPLIEIYGRPFFYWAAQSIVKYVEIASLTFVVLDEHIERYHIDQAIGKYYPEAAITSIPEVLPGAVLTCKEGVAGVANGRPILFNDCDHLFLCEPFYHYCMEGRHDSMDGALLTFRSEDPKFSYVSYDENGFVNRTVEKQVISQDAICGAYYFRDKRIFLDAADVYLEHCAYHEFFMSGVYQVMAQQGKKVRAFPVDSHVSFGTPEEFEDAKTSKEYLKLLGD